MSLTRKRLKTIYWTSLTHYRLYLCSEPLLRNLEDALYKSDHCKIHLKPTVKLFTAVGGNYSTSAKPSLLIVLLVWLSWLLYSYRNVWSKRSTPDAAQNGRRRSKCTSELTYGRFIRLYRDYTMTYRPIRETWVLIFNIRVYCKPLSSQLPPMVSTKRATGFDLSLFAIYLSFK